MKKQRLPILVLFLSLWAFGASAQYDDMYYNPDTDGTVQSYEAVKSDRSQQMATNSERDPRRTGEGYYDDEPYDYYYTSRIRRFHRPMYGFGYFDPYYIDSYYYNPYMMPASTVFIYDMPYSYRRWMRNRAFYDPFWYPGGGFASPYYGVSPGFAFNAGIGFGSGFGWGPSFGFGSGFGYGYGPAYGFGGGYGYGGGFLYCPPSYGGGYAYNTPRSENTVITSRPRTATARSVAPSTGFDRNPRSTSPTVVGRSQGRDNEGLRTSDRMREIRRQAGSTARTRVRGTVTDRTNPQIRTRNAPSSRLYTRGNRATTPSRSFTTPSTRQQRTTTPSWNRNDYNNSRPSIRTQSPTRSTVSPRSSSPTRTSTPRSSSSRRGNNND